MWSLSSTLVAHRFVAVPGVVTRLFNARPPTSTAPDFLAGFSFGAATASGQRSRSPLDCVLELVLGRKRRDLYAVIGLQTLAACLEAVFQLGTVRQRRRLGGELAMAQAAGVGCTPCPLSRNQIGVARMDEGAAEEKEEAASPAHLESSSCLWHKPRARKFACYM